MSSYSDAMFHYLRSREQAVMVALSPVVDEAVAELEELVAALPTGSLERELALQELTADDGPAQRVLARVNDRLRDELARVLADSTGEVRRRAAGALPGASAAFPQLTAQQLLHAVEVDGRSLASWFRRESPSDAMRGWLRRLGSSIREGWARDRAARQLASSVGEAVRSTVRKAIEDLAAGAVWRHGDAQQRLVWETAPLPAKGYRWETERDAKVCPLCRPLEGKTVMRLPDLPEIPLHPGCVLGETLVSTASLVFATRAIYRGVVFTIRTKRGRRLRVTHNHPVLIAEGWIKASELRDGMNLVCHSGRVPGIGLGCASAPHFYDQPASAEDVFQALLASGTMTPAIVPATAMHLHGDGVFIQGNIDVVDADVALKHERQPQVAGKVTRQRRDSLLLEEPRFSSLDALFLGLNATAAGVMSVARQCEAFLSGHLSVSEVHRLAAVARSDARLLEVPGDGASADAVVLREFLDRHPALVELDEVVAVKVDSAHVPVYNFTTASGIYTAEQILSHNCRCGITVLT